jgi:hypothetical protein
MKKLLVCLALATVAVIAVGAGAQRRPGGSCVSECQKGRDGAQICKTDSSVRNKTLTCLQACQIACGIQ